MSMMECTSCGDPVFADMKTCPRCGVVNPAYRTPWWKLVAFGLLVLGAIALVGSVLPSGVMSLVVWGAAIPIGFVGLVKAQKGAFALVAWLIGNVAVIIATTYFGGIFTYVIGVTALYELLRGREGFRVYSREGPPPPQ